MTSTCCGVVSSPRMNNHSVETWFQQPKQRQRFSWFVRGADRASTVRLSHPLVSENRVGTNLVSYHDIYGGWTILNFTKTHLSPHEVIWRSRVFSCPVNNKKENRSNKHGSFCMQQIIVLIQLTVQIRASTMSSSRFWEMYANNTNQIDSTLIYLRKQLINSTQTPLIFISSPNTKVW